MDLTPGEKAVLRQIGVLYSNAGARDQQLKALFMQWTPMHHDAYHKAYGGLLAKQLIEDAGAQSFRITDAGLKAIGVSIPRPAVQPEKRAAVERVAARPVVQREAKPAQSGLRGALSRLLR